MSGAGRRSRRLDGTTNSSIDVGELQVVLRLGSSWISDPSRQFGFVTSNLALRYDVWCSITSLMGDPVYELRTRKAFMLLKFSSNAITFSASSR